MEQPSITATESFLAHQTGQHAQSEPSRSTSLDRPPCANRLQEDSPAESPAASRANTVEQLIKKLEDIASSVRDCHDRLAHLASTTDELYAADQIIADLSTRYRELNERFYEREVLLPVVFCLIRLADRCRQQIQTLKQSSVDPHKQSDKAGLKLTVQSRMADLVEVEQALANLAVESYECDAGTFEPSLQKCISRIVAEDRIHDGHVARRLLPGYKRHGNVIRKEYVSVYVCQHQNQ